MGEGPLASSGFVFIVSASALGEKYELGQGIPLELGPLSESFSLVMDRVVKDEQQTVALAKQLATSFILASEALDIRSCVS